MSFPLVSVIIPTYNQALYLPAALESVLKQTYPSLEIIVIDDGSIDETAEIGKIYQRKSERIHWIEQCNQGPAQARNRAIAFAQGEYICLFDSDDEMYPDRILKQYEVFQNDPIIDIVYTALDMINSNGQRIDQIRGQDHPPEDFVALMLFRNFITTSSIIMAKSRCLKEHPYDPSFKHAEDYELMLRLAHQYRFHYLDLPLIRYRRHTTNLSNSLDAHQASELRILQRYDRAHIEHVVEQTTFSPEEKMMLKGRIFFGQGNIEEALSVFSELTSSLALFYQGNCFLRLQQPTRALQAYQQALQQDPSNAASHNNLGVAYAFEGKLDLAKDCFQKAFLLKPGYMDAEFNLHHSLGPWRITWKELRKNLLPYHENG